MKKIQISPIHIILCYIIFSSCTTPTVEREDAKTIEELQNEAYVDQLIEEFENPSELTGKDAVEITLGNANSVKELLIGNNWKDADNVGMDISFTDNSFIYHIKDYPEVPETWKLILDCNGETSSEGPYIQRGEAEYADCYLIVKLNENELLIEHQGSSVQMVFKR